MMQAAGFTDMTFERFDADICIGRDLDEAVDFAMAIGPAGEIIRLAGEEGATPHATRSSRRCARRFPLYQRGDGIGAPSSTWFVSGRAGD